MQVVPGYILNPFVCLNCQLGHEVPCLDLGRDDEDDPTRLVHLYLCPTCLFHAARTLAPAHGLQLVTDQLLAALEDEIKTLNDLLTIASKTAEESLALRDAVMAQYAPKEPPAPEPEMAGRGKRGQVASDR